MIHPKPKSRISPKARLKAFFKTRTVSSYGIEFLEKFLLPFLQVYHTPENKKEISVDTAIGAWFNIDKRTVIHANAKRAFKMPGEVALAAGGKWTKRWGPRDVAKGQYMLIVMDSKDQTAKVDIEILGKERTFRLHRPEVEFLKDQITWRQG